MEEKESVEAQGMQALKQFVYLHTEIINVYSSVIVNKGGGLDMLKKYIKNYEHLFKSTNAMFEDFAEDFKSLFYANRQHFLDILDDDKFLINGSLQIWVGKGVQKIERNNHRLPISSCYKKAYEMRQMQNKLLNDDPDNDAKIMEKTEYRIYAEFRYFLMKVVYFSLDDGCGDLRLIDNILEDLRTDTMLEEGEETLKHNDMGSILGSVMKKFGGGEMNEKAMKNAIAQTTEAFNDDTITDTIKDVISENKGKKGLTLAESISAVASRVEPLLQSKMGVNNNDSEPPEGVNILGDEESIDKTFKQMKEGIGKVGEFFK